MRLIDADALKNDLTRFYDNVVTAKQLIDEQPTVEAVAVVRCKDCRYGVICIDGNGKELVGCNNFNKFDIQTYCGPYWYCADGER